MNKLLINENYCYYPDFNVLINRELSPIYENADGKEVVLVEDEEITLDAIKRNFANTRNVIFEITQNCNLRCHYCVYGPSYFLNRNHSAAHMTIEIARRSLECLYDLFKSRQQKKIIFSFYGGEPLLQFTLIREIIDAIQLIFKDFEVEFNMTTNVTLLSSEILEYLINKNVNLLVSLDGPEWIHDAKRTFPNGEGSFRRVMNALQMIQNQNDSYYRNNVRISSTFSPDLSISDRYDFFNNDSLVKVLGMSTSRLSERDTNYIDGLVVDEQSNRRQIDYIYDQMKHKLKQGEPLTGFETNFMNTIEDVDGQLSAIKWTPLSGTCLFNARLYIDVEGQFHVCERINNKTPIGNVNEGPNFQRMIQMVRDFKRMIWEHCHNCEARHFCRICFAEVMGRAKFSVCEKFCGHAKSNMMYRLEKYIAFQKENVMYRSR